MKITQLYKRISEVLSICIFLSGSVVLIGWIGDIPVLKSISPDFVSMKANTAICFIFIGLSLWLLQTKSQGNRTARGIARFCAFAVFLIGFLTFLEYIFEWDFGIDQLLFKESAAAILTHSPGMMAFNTSIIFVIIGTALLLCGYETVLFVYIAQLLIIPAGIISLLSFVGYLYGANPLYIGHKFSTAQALHTCVLFIVSCIGCLLARPQQGLMKNISSDNYGGMMLRRILPVVIVIPLVLGWFKIYGAKTGWFGHEFGVSFVATCNLFIVGLFVYMLSAYLNRLDAKRKQTEKALQDSEVRYKTLFSTAVEGILVADVQKKQFIYCNPAVCRMLGYTEEELIHLSVEDIHPKEALDHVMAEFGAQVRGEKKSTEVPCLRKDGTVFDASIGASGIAIDGRECTLGFFTDITERKRTEETISKFKFMVENAGQEVYLVKPEGDLDYVNNAAAKSLGYTVEEMLKIGISGFDPKFGSVFRQHFEDLKTRDLPAFETVHLAKDGRKILKEMKSAYLLIGDKEYVCGFGQDITERKRIETRLQETNDKLTSIANQVSDAMKTAGEKISDGKSIHFETSDLVRCHEVKNCTKTDCPAYNSEEPTRCWETVGTLCKGEVQGIFAKKIKDCRKCEVYQQARRDPICNLRESFNEMLLLLKGWQQNLENALKDTKQAKMRAEAANEAKSRFLANISHEMRTPLNAIIGFSKILMQEELAEEHKEHIRMIYNSGGHLLGLINDILNISSIEAGKMNIEMKQCQLEQLIANIESMMQPFAAEKELTFEIREKGDLPANIVTDAARLQQCLTNLVNNAIKFTEQGHIYVNISLENKDSKPCIRFEVEDTGIGIAAQSQQEIFEPFFQEDVSTSRKYGGTGLGLTIARKFAGLLGGELTLTSEKGKGSVFSLIIPAGVDLAAQPLLNRHKIIDDADKVKENRFSGCILVAEDVKTNQMLMKFLLEKMGLKVTIAENGAEAVDKALGQKFDLIFMDIQMPKVNGYEAARTLRSKGIKTPIVALTAGTMEGDEKKCIEAGCDVYLSKPVVFSKLIETLSKYLPSENQVLIEAVSSASSKAD